MLEEAGRPYERALIDIRSGAQSKPEFRAINPMMKVPALTESLADGEARMAESAAICAYIAERVPEANLAPPLGDPRRGRYLHWLFFSGACIEAAITQKFAGFEMNTVSAGWGDFNRVFDVLEAAVQSGPWILGEQFTAADVMIGSDLRFVIDIFKMVEPRPAFTAYLERCAARPALQRAMAIEAAGK
jgi:glutathione S-transferase